MDHDFEIRHIRFDLCQQRLHIFHGFINAVYGNIVHAEHNIKRFFAGQRNGILQEHLLPLPGRMNALAVHRPKRIGAAETSRRQKFRIAEHLIQRIVIKQLHADGIPDKNDIIKIRCIHSLALRHGARRLLRRIGLSRIGAAARCGRILRGRLGGRGVACGRLRCNYRKRVLGGIRLLTSAAAGKKRGGKKQQGCRKGRKNAQKYSLFHELCILSSIMLNER